MDLIRLTTKLSQTQFLPETSILRKSLRQTPQIVRVLLKLALRRERYCFQLFKYFILFPGTSQMSETQSIDTYDRLIFGDDAIHSMVKRYESKELQNKIWAFLNIKALKYLQKCKSFTGKMEKIYMERLEKPVKSDAFKMIKQYDFAVEIDSMTKNSIKSKKFVNQQTNTCHRDNLQAKLNLYQVKIEGKNYFSSKIMINQSSNSQQRLNQTSNHPKQIDQTKLTQSRHMAESLLQTQDHIPSRISIKSLSAEQNNRHLSTHNTQVKSQTKIRFTYTSPTKDQISLCTQKQSKTSQKIVEANLKRTTKDNNLSSKVMNGSANKYKYSVPSFFQDKKICCENLCGMGCGENCSSQCKGKQNK